MRRLLGDSGDRIGAGFGGAESVVVTAAGWWMCSPGG
jgi:hypothetical protein